jgi:L-fucose/D-arabinose isomerase
MSENIQPKIGIRPAIDGRRKGVRESLETQAMGMAQCTASFLSASLRYPDGSPVQCVIADNCIGGVAEAVQTTEKSVGRMLAFRLPSRPVGVTAAKR